MCKRLLLSILFVIFFFPGSTHGMLCESNYLAIDYRDNVYALKEIGVYNIFLHMPIYISSSEELGDFYRGKYIMDPSCDDVYYPGYSDLQELSWNHLSWKDRVGMILNMSIFPVLFFSFLAYRSKKEIIFE